MRVESLLLEGTQNVSISRLTITPIVQDAWLRIRGSRHVVVEDVLVTAKGTRYRATVQVHGSNHVVIRRSEFRHCGDRSPLSRTACTSRGGRGTSRSSTTGSTTAVAAISSTVASATT